MNLSKHPNSTQSIKTDVKPAIGNKHARFLVFSKTLLASACLGLMSISALANSTPNPLPEVAAIHRPDNIDLLKDRGLIANKPVVAPIPKKNYPNRLSSTIKGNPATMRAFNWYTTDRFLESHVRISTRPDMKDAKEFPARTEEVTSHYIERDDTGHFIFRLAKESGDIVGYFTNANRKSPWQPRNETFDIYTRMGVDIQKQSETVYKAEATGLMPNTTYYYQVGGPQSGYSKVGTFKTAATAGTAAPFSFIQYTDTQNIFYNEHIRNEARFGADTLLQAQKLVPNAAFAVHTGDFVEIAEAEDEWVDLMTQSEKAFLAMSLVPASGNHDEFAIKRDTLFTTKFNEHFNVDSAGKIDGGSYYSFDYNNAHFVVLNTNDYKNDAKTALSDEQMAWMRDDIQKARARGATWVILAYHKPLFSKGYHSLQDTEVQNVREAFMKAIDELDVDLALQGHDHVYSRTKSLNYAPKDSSFVNAQVEDVKYTYNGQNIKTYLSPKGTTFVIPNTAGTKTYDVVFNRSLAHIHKVRPKLNWLTQAQLDHYNSLFEAGFQPDRSARFEDNISNLRDSSIQTFATYTIDGNTLTASVYQVSGDLTKGERRVVTKVDEFSIQK